MNPETADRFASDVESGIAKYLQRVDTALRGAGHSDAARTSTVDNLDHQIRAQLQRHGTPTAANLDKLLASMDPPEAFGEAPDQARPASPSGRRTMAPVALALLAAFGLWAWRSKKPADAENPPSPMSPVAETPAAASPATPPQEPVVLPDPTPATAQSMAVAVAAFDCTGNIVDRDAVRSVVSDGLINALAMTDGLRVVERARLKEALGELKLGAEGLVSTATALELGKLTGARVILTGTIARIGDELILTARLINAETGELTAARVTGDRAGLLAMVDELAQKVIQRIAKDDKGVLARADDTSRAQLREKQMALKSALVGRPLPRVLVLIPESHLQKRIPDPAGETELVLWLTDAGFHVASPEYEGLHARTPVASWTDETEIQFRGLRASATAEGVINISRQVLKQILQSGYAEQRESLLKVADVMILGEGISEHGSEREGLISCKARVELKVIDIKTGRVLLAKSDYGAGVDVAEHIAGKRALQAAARSMAPDLIVEMVNAWQGATSP